MEMATPYIDGMGDWGSDSLFPRPNLRACKGCGHEHRKAVCDCCGQRYDNEEP
jgi:hypothetical protein